MELLLNLLIWFGVIFLMMKFGCGAHHMGRGDKKPVPRVSSADEGRSIRWIAPTHDVDPVCGQRVRTDRAKSSVYDGDVYYFCSRDCRELFEADPKSYPKRLAGANDAVRVGQQPTREPGASVQNNNMRNMHLE